MKIKFYNQWNNQEEKLDIFEFDIEWIKVRNILVIELSIIGLEIDILIG